MTIKIGEIIEKLSIGHIELIDDFVPLEAKFFYYNEVNDLKLYLEKFIKESTIPKKQIIKIVEPYLSIELLEILENSADSKTEIQILTTTIAGDKKVNEPLILNKLIDISSDRKIIVKQVIEVGDTVNMQNRAKSPFHDRFIMDDINILNIGISLNGLSKNDTIINKYKDGKKFRDFFDSVFNGKNFKYLGNNLTFEQYFPKI